MGNEAVNTLTIDNKEAMKEAIKPMFYLLTGKPDNLLKIYDRDVLITPDCIKELNDMINEKLAHFDVNGLIFTSTISFQDNKVIEFGSWNEFDIYKWNIPEEIKSIVVKWDFLVTLRDYKAPQRHSITLRISQKTTQKEMLMLMLNNELENIENIDLNNSPMFCRVDFINTLLGTEIIELVERWNKSRKRPKNYSRFSSYVYKKRRIVAKLIQYSFPIFIFLLILSSINFITNKFSFDSLSSENLKPYLFWMVTCVVLFATCKKISFLLAKTFYESMVESRQYSIFQLTNGDKNKNEEINKTSVLKNIQVLLSFSMSVILNITTSVISAYFLQ